VEGQCRITFMDRKQCSSCRYTKCLRIGMRPQLVLNDDEKKRRFKKFLSKKGVEGSDVVEDNQYSDDDSMHQRVTDMPPLEPIEANQNYPLKFSREIPFSCSFQPSTSTTLYNSPMYSSKHMNTSPDWKAQNPKSYRIPETDFLSGLRSEVKNYVKKSQQYNQTNTQTFPAPADYPTKSGVFSLPSKHQQTKAYMPTPPPSPSDQPPLGYPNKMKDVEAWQYFASQGFLPANVFPQSTLTSPDRLRTFLVGPDQTKLYVKAFLGSVPSQVPSYPVKSDYSTHQALAEQRPSVITNYSAYSDKTCSNSESENSFKIKLEKLDEEFEEKDKEKNLETTPVSSAKVYLPQNLTITKENKEEEPNNNDELIFKYVHKKFRNTVENSEKDKGKNEENNFPQKRKSVIFHASSNKRICVE